MTCSSLDELLIHNNLDKATFTGFYFKGSFARESFFSVTCPCGITHSCAPEDFPKTDTPHKCGKPNHWFAQFKE